MSEPSAAESLATFTEFPLDVSAKTSDDVDALPVPVPTVEEAKLIANFKKRNKAAQAKYPSIRGLPHFLYEGTVKLPGKPLRETVIHSLKSQTNCTVFL